MCEPFKKDITFQDKKNYNGLLLEQILLALETISKQLSCDCDKFIANTPDTGDGQVYGQA